MGEDRSVTTGSPDTAREHGTDEESGGLRRSRRAGAALGAHALALAGFAVLTLNEVGGTRATVTFH